eukprot:2556435-Amphidinium_carterae.1
MPTAAKPEVTKLLDLIPSAVWAKVDMADFAAPPVGTSIVFDCRKHCHLLWMQLLSSPECAKTNL